MLRILRLPLIMTMLLMVVTTSCSGDKTENKTTDVDSVEAATTPTWRAEKAELPPVHDVDWPVVEGYDDIPDIPLKPVMPPVRETALVDGMTVDAEHPVVYFYDYGDMHDLAALFVETLRSKYSAAQCRICYINPENRVMVLETAPALRREIIEYLNSTAKEEAGSFYNPKFVVAENEVMVPSFIENYPGDPEFENQKNAHWAHDAINVGEAWIYTHGDPSVNVAVIDSYFDLTHPEFNGLNVTDAFSMPRGNSDVAFSDAESLEYMKHSLESLKDPSAKEIDYISQKIESSKNHGTHVLGIIAAQPDNGWGVCGIAPRCTIIPISLGLMMTSTMTTEAISYAIDKNAKVINLSLGIVPRKKYNGDIDSQIDDIKNNAVLYNKKNLNEIYKKAEKAGTVIIWSAGNENVLTQLDPRKDHSFPIMVESVDPKLKKTNFSNFSHVDGLPYESASINSVSAPGENIYSTIYDSEFDYFSGTSMAAPVVTGTAALICSICPDASPYLVKSLLSGTAHPTDDDRIGGVIDAGAAVRRASTQHRPSLNVDFCALDGTVFRYNPQVWVNVRDGRVAPFDSLDEASHVIDYVVVGKYKSMAHIKCIEHPEGSFSIHASPFKKADSSKYTIDKSLFREFTLGSSSYFSSHPSRVNTLYLIEDFEPYKVGADDYLRVYSQDGDGKFFPFSDLIRVPENAVPLPIKQLLWPEKYKSTKIDI